MRNKLLFFLLFATATLFAQTLVPQVPPGEPLSQTHDGLTTINRTVQGVFDDGALWVEWTYEPTLSGRVNASMMTWEKFKGASPVFVSVEVNMDLPGVTRFYRDSQLYAVYDNQFAILTIFEGDGEHKIHYAAK